MLHSNNKHLGRLSGLGMKTSLVKHFRYFDSCLFAVMCNR